MTRRQICEDFLKNHSKNKLKEDRSLGRTPKPYEAIGRGTTVLERDGEPWTVIEKGTVGELNRAHPECEIYERPYYHAVYVGDDICFYGHEDRGKHIFVYGDYDDVYNNVLAYYDDGPSRSWSVYMKESKKKVREASVDEDDWEDEEEVEKDFTTEDAVQDAFPMISPHTVEIIAKWYKNEYAIDDFDSLQEFSEHISSDFLDMFWAGDYDNEEFHEVAQDMINVGYYDADRFPYDEDLEESVNKKAIKEDVWGDIADIERGGFDEFRDDEYENADRARHVHNAAKAAGMSDIEYVEMEDLFEQDPDLEDVENGSFSEFLVDDEGNPGLEDAKVIFDNLYNGNYKGMYDGDYAGDAEACLVDVIEGYNQSAWEAQVPLKDVRMFATNRMRGFFNEVTEYEARLQYLAQYKDNPKCVRCKQYFNALATYARQINEIADEYNLPKYKITIPEEGLTESKKRNLKEAYFLGNEIDAEKPFSDDWTKWVQKMSEMVR